METHKWQQAREYRSLRIRPHTAGPASSSIYWPPLGASYLFYVSTLILDRRVLHRCLCNVQTLCFLWVLMLSDVSCYNGYWSILVVDTDSQVTASAGISFVTNSPPSGGNCEVSLNGSALVRAMSLAALFSFVWEVTLNTTRHLISLKWHGTGRDMKAQYLASDILRCIVIDSYPVNLLSAFALKFYFWLCLNKT